MSPRLRLLSLARPAWRQLAAAVAAGVLTVAAGVGLLVTAAYLIAAAALQPPLSVLSPAIAGVRLFTMLRAAARYLERCLAHDATLRLISSLRVRLYAAALRLPPTGSADLYTRLVEDIDRLQFFFLRLVLPPLVALLATVALALFLGGFAGELALPALAGCLAAGLLLPLAAHRRGEAQGQRLAAARTELDTAVIDSLRGWRELTAAGRISLQGERLAGADRRLAAVQRRLADLTGLAEGASGFIMGITALAVFLAAAALVRQGQLPGVWLGALALAVQGVTEAILPLAGGFRHWGESAAAAGRVVPLAIARPDAGEPPADAGEPANFDLELNDVHFRYRPDGPPALEGISLSLPAGRRVAVVGASGAGKSTLAGLLLRLWERKDGSIRLGGRDIGEYPPETVRAAIGLVPQQSHIFNATVAANIRLAAPSAGDGEVDAAARAAGLGALIDEWPLGLDTPAGENGLSLSGGERQRVAIARLLLKKPAIVILDEPTANLDPPTERAVMATLLAATAGRTLLLITHRLSGLGAMDEIIVLEGGRVAERGRLDELIAAGGLFAEMWRIERETF